MQWFGIHRLIEMVVDMCDGLTVLRACRLLNHQWYRVIADWPDAAGLWTRVALAIDGPLSMSWRALASTAPWYAAARPPHTWAHVCPPQAQSARRLCVVFVTAHYDVVGWFTDVPGDVGIAALLARAIDAFDIELDVNDPQQRAVCYCGRRIDTEFERLSDVKLAVAPPTSPGGVRSDAVLLLPAVRPNPAQSPTQGGDSAAAVLAALDDGGGEDDEASRALPPVQWQT